MTRIGRISLIIVILFACVGCDQITKLAARTYLAASPPTSYLNEIFRLQYIENPGAFLSFGSAFPSRTRFWMFTVLTGIGLAGMVVLMLVHDRLTRRDIVGLSLFVAGGVGNLIDRTVNHGAVIDFMNIGIGSLRTGIFNFADVMMMVGDGVLLFFSFQRRSRRRIQSSMISSRESPCR